MFPPGTKALGWRIAAVCLLLPGTLAIAAETSVPAKARPNVILIVTDDQGYGDLSCHGNPWLKTPNLDRLHDQSVSLENYHTDPYCTPSRAAVLTGRYSIRTGAWSVTQGRQLLKRGEMTMAEVFAASGYRTAMFGKWHLGDPFPYAPQYRGFQEVVCHLAGGVDEIGNPVGNDYFDDVYYRNGQPEKFQGYCTDIWFAEAMKFIREKAGAASPKPFFIYLPTNAMHSPFNVAEEYSAPFRAQGHPEDRAKFYGMIVNFDENLGHLMNALAEANLEQDTILIFMSDNGTAEGAGNPSDKVAGFNAGMREHKGSVYDGGHRVPCFIRWPARLKAGRKVNQLTAHFDLLPTLIDLCGLQTPRQASFDGQSLRPLLEGDSKDWADRTLFIERQEDDLREWQPRPAKAKALPQMAVLTERWRLVNGELYDIATDRGQEHNLADQYPEVVTSLIEAHARWFDEIARTNEDYPRFLIGAPEENPTRFTVRDWHPVKGNVIWQPSQLSRDDLVINGFWAVEAVRAGRYEIRLSRYPEVAEKPMQASQAELSIGAFHETRSVTPDAASVAFELDLPAGPALLRTTLTDAKTSHERGAYFIRATWLGETL